ncbi:MAG: TOBE domain-containing protein, partial [Gemmatimonadota bacterium]|nr:TOBE domain-containing protein [Gemmatimonadota bacterium]
AQAGPGALPATVTGRRFVGPSALFTVLAESGSLIEVVAPPRAVKIGERVGVMPSRRAGGGIHLFPPESR